MSKEIILAIDDLEENLMMIKISLRKLDFELVTARSGREAIKIVENITPDLILMDIQMPGIDGYETAMIIKNKKGFEDIPILFLSALKDLDNIVKCFEAGGVDYVSKPFRTLELVSRIQAHLKIRRLQKRIIDENARTNAILQNILPQNYILELKNGNRPQTQLYEDVVVMFTDFRNFTGISLDLGPQKSIDSLNQIFFAFDEIITKFDLERVKTIGDGYFAIGGVNSSSKDAPIKVIAALLKMQEFVQYYNILHPDVDWDLRVGADIGPVIAGIVGYQKIAFDVWGQPVNIASRLQSVAELKGIAISDNLYEKVVRWVTLERTEKKHLHRLGDVHVNYVSSLSTNAPFEIQSTYESLNVKSLIDNYLVDNDILNKIFDSYDISSNLYNSNNSLNN